MPLPAPPPVGTAMLPPDTYAGQVVVVTGGGTGLGKAMAAEFARLGAAVAVASRKAEHRESGVRALTALGAKAIGVELDVRDEGAVTATFDQIERELGPADVLINNAAGNFPSQAVKMSANAWRSVVDIVAQWHVPVQHRIRPPGHRAICSRRHPQHRRHLLVDGRSRHRAFGGRQGRRHESDTVPGRRMGAQRRPGQLPGARPLPARRLTAGAAGPTEPRSRRQAHSRRPSRAAARIGLGRNLPLLTVCRLSDRSHPRPRWCQLAAPRPHHARVRSHR